MKKRFFNSVADLRGLKGSDHEGGIRVPGIIRWPGKVAAGKVIDQPAYSADIMPTLCALTGADPGKPYVIGSSILPWAHAGNPLEEIAELRRITVAA